MNTNKSTKTEVKFTTAKNGQRRAYRFSCRQLRWFPMPLAEAELAVATGQAEDITATAVSFAGSW